MILQDNEFAIVEFEPEKSLMKRIWKDYKTELTDELFKKEMLQQAEFYRQYKPKLMLIDARNLKYYIDHDTQLWINQNAVMPLIQGGCKKLAMVLPPEVIAKISLQQTMSESVAQNLETKYFEDPEDALNWLLGN